MNPSKPLPNARHEAFAQAIVRGAKLGNAYLAAGFKAKDARQAGYDLRHKQHVNARIESLLNGRVKADARSFARRQKVKGDILEAAVNRLAEIAFTDPREVFAWKNEAVTNADGEVVGERTRLITRDSADLSPAAASLVRGAFVKAGEVKLETHDQRAALVDLVKLLKGSDAVTNNVVVNQNTVNVGSLGAVDAAQRIAFLLAAAATRPAPAIAPEPVAIEGDPVQKS